MQTDFEFGNQYGIERSEVSLMFKQQGVTPEALKLLDDWIAQKHEQEKRGEITYLAFSVSLADLYRDAGLFEEALVAYEEAAKLVDCEASRMEKNDKALLATDDPHILDAHQRMTEIHYNIWKMCHENVEKLRSILKP